MMRIDAAEPLDVLGRGMLRARSGHRVDRSTSRSLLATSAAHTRCVEPRTLLSLAGLYAMRRRADEARDAYRELPGDARRPRSSAGALYAHRGDGRSRGTASR